MKSVLDTWDILVSSLAIPIQLHFPFNVWSSNYFRSTWEVVEQKGGQNWSELRPQLVTEPALYAILISSITLGLTHHSMPISFQNKTWDAWLHFPLKFRPGCHVSLVYQLAAHGNVCDCCFFSMPSEIISGSAETTWPHLHSAHRWRIIHAGVYFS